MKKSISFILALVMVACMSITAFAAEGPGGSTKLTTTVPEPSYILHIPADQAITYGDTETNIGKATVSNVGSNIKIINVKPSWTNFTDGSGHSIPLTLVFDFYMDGVRSLNHAQTSAFANTLYSAGKTSNIYCEYFVQVAENDWKAAAPGNYSATITWTSSYTLK